MKTKVIKKEKDYMIIHWEKGTMFGQLVIEYDDRGGFTIDAEYLSLDDVIEIIKQL